jgi:thymidine kinase
MSGQIELIIGPMFGGKTSELVSRIRRAVYANQDALLIKYRDDTRYSDGDVVTTHAETQQPTSDRSDKKASIRVVNALTLSEVEVVEPIIGIDEGQFYPDLVEVCERWALEGRRVIIAALDGDFARRPFGQVCELIPRCESVEKRRAVCMQCRQHDAAFTKRIGGGKAIIEIGACESYRAVCRHCYFTD